MTLVERIKAAILIFEGKTTADKAEIASLTTARDAAVTAQQTAEAATAAVTAQLATANNTLAAVGDPVALAASVVQLEALATAP